MQQTTESQNWVDEEGAALERLLRQRHSVRGVLARPIPAPLLTRVFELAQLAPSNVNAQPWRVDVLSGGAAERMGKAHLHEAGSGAGETPDYPITVVRPGEYRTSQIDAAKELSSATGVTRADRTAR